MERKYRAEFGGDPRNVWFGLSTDGTKPFGEQRSNHKTWPVTLCIYNLPPWKWMKRKFIMMPFLIQGPKQPDNDIDVYLRPFVTINDWPALSNLSGHTNKGYHACTHC